MLYFFQILVNQTWALAPCLMIEHQWDHANSSWIFSLVIARDRNTPSRTAWDCNNCFCLRCSMSFSRSCSSSDCWRNNCSRLSCWCCSSCNKLEWNISSDICHSDETKADRVRRVSPVRMPGLIATGHLSPWSIQILDCIPYSVAARTQIPQKKYLYWGYIISI